MDGGSSAESSVRDDEERNGIAQEVGLEDEGYVDGYVKQRPHLYHKAETSASSLTAGGAAQNTSTPQDTLVNMNGQVSTLENSSKITTLSNGTSNLKPDDKWTTGSTSTSTSEDRSFGVMIKQNHLREKSVFVLSVVTVVALSFGILSMHWLLPYYYAVSCPILIVIRIILYWKYKWQYFLLDFCYFANTLCYTFLWAVPSNQLLFAVVFALSNGPLPWAAAVYRNSLVFHSADKMTSTYIHMLPAFLAYSIRWYGASVSKHWYKPFIAHFSEDTTFMFVWLFSIPLSCFILHSFVYVLIVYVILRPDEKYLNSYRYLTAKEGSLIGRLVNICGPKARFPLYHMFNWLYCAISLLTTILVWKYFIAHTVLLAVICTMITWNGASFYTDVFSVRGFKSDE